jgi:alpha-methylacyl-CoA racemase
VTSPRGPLDGVRVLEIASIAPAPFACMMLSDLGADVLRVDRVDDVPAAAPSTPPPDPLRRGRRSVAVDLKSPGGVRLVLALAERADVLVEGFRPGVCERLGIGPDACLERNPRLVYGRLTGYGQDGPWSGRAGHDITYLALSGALYPIGPADAPPPPPINYVADFGGGAMPLVVGVLAALLERDRCGLGQVVDVSMTEGAGLLSSLVHGLAAEGRWTTQRGTNVLDGSAPFYRCYACADGGFVAVGALEPQFYAQLLEDLGLSTTDLPEQYDSSSWPALAQRLAGVFATRSRDEWAQVFADTDACVAPVLTPAEAARHPHAVARGAFVEVAGQLQPAPVPRLSRTPSAVQGAAPHPGQHGDAALADWGLDEAEVLALLDAGEAQ